MSNESRHTQDQAPELPPRSAAHWGRDYGAMYRQTQRYIREVSMSFGLTYNEVIALVYIMENPNSSQDRIAHDLSLDKATTTKLLKGLEAGGYIAREVDETNQRKKRVRALPKARPCIELVNFAIREFNKEILTPIPAAEQERFLMELHSVSGRALDIDYAELAKRATERFNSEHA